MSRRLQIVKYFDSVINDIDIFTETKIVGDNSLEKVLNERRDQQIKFIRQVEQAALSKIDSINELDVNQQTEFGFMDEFCFSVKYAELMFVVKVNRFVTNEEVDRFKAYLNWNELNKQEKLDLFTNMSGFSKNYKLKNSEMDDNQYEKFLTADSVIVDMTSWFQEGPHFKSLSLDTNFNTDEHPPAMYQENQFKIDEITFFGYIDLPERVELVARDIRNISRCFKGATKISVTAFFSNIKLDNWEVLSNALSEDNRISASATCDLSYKTLIQADLDKMEFVKRILVWYNQTSLISQKPWPFLIDLNFSNCSLDTIAAIPFTNFPSLKNLKIWIYRDQSLNNVDWTFLDPVRQNLESLDIYLEKYQAPPHIFLGMNNLKQLGLNVFQQESIIISHMSCLKKLELTLSLLTFNINYESSTLEEFSLNLTVQSPPKNDEANQVSLCFNFPKLTYLYVTMASEDAIFKVFRNFVHVKKLKLNLKDYVPLRNDLLKDFTSLQSLELSFNETETIDSQVFVGLESLTELTLNLRSIHDIASDALNSLVNLEFINILIFEDMDLDNHGPLYTVTPYDPSDLARFKKLRSLKKINIQRWDQATKHEEFVYFPDINKFVLLSKCVDNKL